MNKFKEEVSKELTEHILPFWMRLIDKKNGGFFGEIDFELNINEKADKGGIAAARLLWTFSAAYRVTKNKLYLEYATHIYNFIVDKLFDQEYKGIYWMVDYQGLPKDQRKHVYTQSFGIYGLSEYYRVTKNEEVLELAKDLYYLIEEKGYNPINNAYMEEFDREWNKVPNVMLSENGVIAEITMNTHIHVIEAYTNLYKVWPTEELKDRLDNLLKIHYQRIYNEETKSLGVFFDENWKSILDIKSFGHDIEASWLIDETLKTINEKNQDYDEMVIDIAYEVAKHAIADDGSMYNEQVNGHIDKTRIWWVQAEAIVGFMNAYEKTNDKAFLILAKNVWNYTKQNIIDKRENGEWFWSIEPDGSITKRNIGEPWKVSYHNGRFCLEIIERMSENDS